MMTTRSSNSLAPRAPIKKVVIPEETPLQKVVRLAAVPVKSFQRVEGGRVQQVRSFVQNRTSAATDTAKPQVTGPPQQRYGTPFRSAWGKVSIGDVLELGSNLWRVIPSSQYPGHKPSTRSGAVTGSGPGQTPTTTVGVGTPGAKTTSGTSTASGSSTGTANIQVYQHYLQNVRHPGKFATLKLPGNFVVTIVPVLP